MQLVMSRDALKFGRYTLKSGKASHYWLDTGALCAGHRMFDLGRILAATLRHHFGDDVDVVLASGTDAIPVTVVACQYYSLLTGHPNEWGFIRPLELVIAGSTVGGRLASQRKVVVMEDMLTAAAGARAAVHSARSTGATVLGVCSLIDRMEREKGKLVSAQLRKELGCKVVTCATVSELAKVLPPEVYQTSQLELLLHGG